MRAASLVAVVVLLPFEVTARLGEVAGTAPGYNRVIVLTPFDVPLVVLAALTLPSLPARIRASGWGVRTLGVLAGSGALALVFHPSWRGVSVVVRVFGAVVVAAEVAAFDRDLLRRRVALPLLGSATLQGAVAIAQVVGGGPVGLATLGERRTLYSFGGTVAGQGTMIHPYVLAGFCLVAVLIGLALVPATGARRRSWTILAAAAAAPLGVTYSRTAVLGVAVAGAFLVVAAWRQPALRRPLVAVGIAVAVPAAIWNAGWVERAGASAEGDLDALTSGRVTLTREAVDLIADHPLVGVGPGRYTTVLETGYSPERIDAVHTVPLLVAAEDGIPAGVALLLALVAVGAAAVATGPVAAALCFAAVPFLLLDKWLYLHPNGLILMALWLGALDVLRRPAGPEEAKSSPVS